MASSIFRGRGVLYTNLGREEPNIYGKQVAGKDADILDQVQVLYRQ